MNIEASLRLLAKNDGGPNRSVLQDFLQEQGREKEMPLLLEDWEKAVRRRLSHHNTLYLWNGWGASCQKRVVHNMKALWLCSMRPPGMWCEEFCYILDARPEEVFDLLKKFAAEPLYSAAESSLTDIHREVLHRRIWNRRFYEMQPDILDPVEDVDRELSEVLNDRTWGLHFDIQNEDILAELATPPRDGYPPIIPPR